MVRSGHAYSDFFPLNNGKIASLAALACSLTTRISSTHLAWLAATAGKFADGSFDKISGHATVQTSFKYRHVTGQIRKDDMQCHDQERPRMAVCKREESRMAVLRPDESQRSVLSPGGEVKTMLVLMGR